MERLPRFAWYLGIGMAITLFVLFLITALPGIIENSWINWEMLHKGDNLKEEIYARFVEQPTYVAMYDRFPDAKEELNFHNHRDINMKVGVMNFETQNQLMLYLNYNEYDDKVHASVYCNVNSASHKLDTDGLFVEEVIQNTNCLDIVYDSNVEP